ncbi:HlyD family secretion protein [Galbibacter mesophilus]|uniref:HlyD family secretion protein n=1 Tax=Galbibacter mesophilus TaxID=379069 RepID=UPI00191E31EF|nr:HlyD family secretion protein [Galbibacter mesophilus]MCM5661379.1 HlyD family secretion protein [Galbibacter mesophilus]
MEILLLAIYGCIVWLVFFKYKLLPWNTFTQAVAIIIPVVSIAILILFLNIVAPSSHDVRVINYNVEVVPAVSGLVTEVNVEPNQHVKKGEVLYKIDPVPFEWKVKDLQARIPMLEAKLISAKAYDAELENQIEAASSNVSMIDAQLELAMKRLEQTQELALSGAGSKFDYEEAQANVKHLQAQKAAAQAQKSQYIQRISAVVSDGELSEIAQARADLEQAKAQLEEAKWKLEQTVYRAPADGRVVNLQLRPGAMAVQFPIKPVMTFIEDEQWVTALFHQNEIRYVEPGQEAEIALKTYPNRIIKCEVDHIVWANAQGQLKVSGTLPDTQDTHLEEGRFAVRLKIAEEDRDLFLAPGAVGQGAIYTDHGAIIHLVRKVIIRVGTKMDWLVLKLH